MEFLLPVILFLLAAAAALGWKVHLLRRAVREIGSAFRQRLTEDTNTLIDVPCRDPAVRSLASDINAQLRLLRAQRRRYQQGDRHLKEAVTDLSHDLRTPLTALCGYLELLKQQELPPQAGRYLAQIEDRAQAMKALAAELFAYSLAVSGQPLSPEPVDLRRALEDTLLAFYGSFRQKGVEPALELDKPDSLFLLDKGALGRILGNILANALKYSAGELRVALDKTGRIVFSNPAPGLDAVAAGRLFDRFYTVDAAQNSTGLGLSIARTLTGEMGGEITAAYRDGCLEVRLDFSPALLPPAAKPDG